MQVIPAWYIPSQILLQNFRILSIQNKFGGNSPCTATLFWGRLSTNLRKDIFVDCNSPLIYFVIPSGHWYFQCLTRELFDSLDSLKRNIRKFHTHNKVLEKMLPSFIGESFTVRPISGYPYPKIFVGVNSLQMDTFIMERTFVKTLAKRHSLSLPNASKEICSIIYGLHYCQD